MINEMNFCLHCLLDLVLIVAELVAGDVSLQRSFSPFEMSLDLE